MPIRKPLPTFGPMVQRLRDARRLTQQELAEQVGIHVVSLSRLELGVRQPSLELAERIAAALGVPLAVFLPPRLPARDWRAVVRRVRRSSQSPLTTPPPSAVG